MLTARMASIGALRIGEVACVPAPASLTMHCLAVPSNAQEPTLLLLYSTEPGSLVFRARRAWGADDQCYAISVSEGALPPRRQITTLADTGPSGALRRPQSIVLSHPRGCPGDAGLPRVSVPPLPSLRRRPRD